MRGEYYLDAEHAEVDAGVVAASLLAHWARGLLGVCVGHRSVDNPCADPAPGPGDIGLQPGVNEAGANKIVSAAKRILTSLTPGHTAALLACGGNTARGGL